MRSMGSADTGQGNRRDAMNKPEVPECMCGVVIESDSFSEKEINSKMLLFLQERVNGLIDCVKWLMENTIPLDPAECQRELNDARTEFTRDFLKHHVAHEKPKPEYCCDDFKASIDDEDFVRPEKKGTHPNPWYCPELGFGLEFCPFCGKELK